MKQKIAVSILIMILATFMCGITTVLASESTEIGEQENFKDAQQGFKKEDVDSMLESGTVSTYGKTKQENVPVQITSTEMNLINRVLGRLLLIFPMLMNDMMSKITSNQGVVFTVEKAISNYYDLFNLEFLINPLIDGEEEGSGDLLRATSQNTASWFVGIRNLALAGSVVTLIYVGIRLAISTVATQRAQYKKMMFSWLEGIVIMTLLQFFIVLIIVASNWVVDILKDTITKDENTFSVEEQVMKNVDTNLDNITEPQNLFFYTILYAVFTYYEFKFFVLYLGRFTKVSFYIIISPLVCLTYPIDKIGDGSAQAFNNWILEFALTAFMQPIHLLIYLVVVYSMGEIIIRNPLIGVLFLAMLSHIEKEVKSILKLQPSLSKGLKDIGLSRLVNGS